MTRAFPRPVAVALGCLLFAGSVGVAGSQIATTPVRSVRVAAAPTTVATLPPTTTPTTVPTTTTTTMLASPPPTTAAPRPVPSTSTSTTVREFRIPRVATTLPIAECSIVHSVGTDEQGAQAAVRVNVPSQANTRVIVGMRYTNLQTGLVEAVSHTADLDGAGNSGPVFLRFTHAVGQDAVYYVSAGGHRLCETPVFNADGTIA